MVATTTSTYRYTKITNDFMSPKIARPVASTPAKTNTAGKLLANAGKFIYDTMIGDNIKTLKNPNASLFAKSLAVVDLASNFIPGAGQAKAAASFAVKAGAKLLKEPAKQVAKAVASVAKEATSKAVGWVKGLFAKSSPPVPSKQMLSGPVSGDSKGIMLSGTGSNKKTQGIYEFIDTRGKPYVGQSGNIDKRVEQHVKSGKLSPENKDKVNITEVLGGKTNREVAEHKRIQEITGGVPARFSNKVSNQVDPIGPSRRHLLE